MIPCKHCNGRVAVNALRCPHCGGRLRLALWQKGCLGCLLVPLAFVVLAVALQLVVDAIAH